MLQIQSETVPVVTYQSGIARIAGTRVPLACIVEMFDDGASPEEIVDAYDVLQLADVYAVITYDLRHQDEVRAHLSRENQQAEQAFRPIEQSFPNALRARLLKARQERQKRDGD